MSTSSWHARGSKVVVVGGGAALDLVTTRKIGPWIHPPKRGRGHYLRPPLTPTWNTSVNSCSNETISHPPRSRPDLGSWIRPPTGGCVLYHRPLLSHRRQLTHVTWRQLHTRTHRNTHTCTNTQRDGTHCATPHHPDSYQAHSPPCWPVLHHHSPWWSAPSHHTSIQGAFYHTDTMPTTEQTLLRMGAAAKNLPAGGRGFYHRPLLSSRKEMPTHVTWRQLRTCQYPHLTSAPLHSPAQIH